MSKLLDKCRAYGADVDATMDHFIGDEELFESCMEQFIQDEGFAGVKEAIEKEDYKAAFEYAHALKGVAGNLGLTPLFHEISAMVESFRVGDYSQAEDQYARILKERDKVNQLMED